MQAVVLEGGKGVLFGSLQRCPLDCTHICDFLTLNLLQGERDAFRGRIKLLKEMVVHGGFLESGGEEMSEDRQEAEFAALQDGIAEIKRALTEFVTCWNIE